MGTRGRVIGQQRAAPQSDQDQLASSIGQQDLDLEIGPGPISWGSSSAAVIKIVSLFRAVFAVIFIIIWRRVFTSI
jgi:hypothetical protein